MIFYSVLLCASSKPGAIFENDIEFFYIDVLKPRKNKQVENHEKNYAASLYMFFSKVIRSSLLQTQE